MFQKLKSLKMGSLWKVCLTVSVAAALILSCGRKKTGQAAAERPASAEFPSVEVPGVISDPSGRLDYMLMHFWDGLTSPDTKGVCDSLHIQGIDADDVEQQFGMYATLLWQVPVSDAARYVSAMFSAAESCAERDTSSNVFEKLTCYAQKYFYDPNSPLRNEEFYLPYLKGLIASSAVPESMKPAYVYDCKMCSLNRVGEKAADLSFRDLYGKNHTLYGVKADYTLLFFSNPGCPNCKEITEMLENDPDVADMLHSGRLAVVNIYIDQELDKWREYASGYPKEWLSGYDYKYVVRTDVTYNVRAIPSLYLLDRDKRVMMKDAPQDKVFEALKSIAS